MYEEYMKRTIILTPNGLSLHVKRRTTLYVQNVKRVSRMEFFVSRGNRPILRFHDEETYTGRGMCVVKKKNVVMKVGFTVGRFYRNRVNRDS